MKKILIFGNSGSGKSTLALRLSEREGLAHLDLDTLAWEPTTEPTTAPTTAPTRRTLALSEAEITAFIRGNDNWVVEGCYGDLLVLLLEEATQVIFLDLPVTECIANTQNRPWEPHKYSSKAAQDANLGMLINWIKDYESRQDVFSRQAHESLYQEFQREKIRYQSRTEIPVV